MDGDKVRALFTELSKFHLVSDVRVAFEYDPQLVTFLRDRGYNFCVEDDAFGVQIVVSDANYTRVVATKDGSD